MVEPSSPANTRLIDTGLPLSPVHYVNTLGPRDEILSTLLTSSVFFFPLYSTVQRILYVEGKVVDCSRSLRFGAGVVIRDVLPLLQPRVIRCNRPSRPDWISVSGPPLKPDSVHPPLLSGTQRPQSVTLRSSPGRDLSSWDFQSNPTSRSFLTPLYLFSGPSLLRVSPPLSYPSPG